MTRLIALVALSFALVACSDDDNKPPPDTGVDQAITDQWVSPDTEPPHEFGPGDLGPLEANVGQACTGDTDCKPGSPKCVLGICTLTCVTDADCPDAAKQACATVDVGGVEADHCLLRCTPSETQNPCPAGTDTACTPGSTAYSVVLDVAVCWDSPCATDKDCPVSVPKKTCTADTECDTTAGQYCDTVNGQCALPGSCNTQSGLCQAHAHGKAGAQIGDPCQSDLDCANDQFCDPEFVDSGITYVRNGYCTKAGCTFDKTLTSAACPTGSGCNRAYFGGLCQKTCAIAGATDCRNNSADFLGDYECYAWQNISEGNVTYSDVPLCDYAPFNTCDYLQPDGLECKDVGDATNSTNMSCRDPKTNQAKTNKYDPTGFCLDDTASGPLQP